MPARPGKLKKDTNVHQGLAAIAGPCAERVTSALEHARSRSDMRSLHRLRVSAWRLRAALGIFRDHIPVGTRQRLRSGLRWLRRKTGPARDWDVFVAETLRRAANHGAGRDVVAIAPLAAAKRAQARRRTQAALASRKGSRLRTDLEAFAAECRGPKQRLAQQRARETVRGNLLRLADAALQKRHRKLRKLARTLDTLEAEALHRLRIRSKALRYTAELLADLYSSKAVKRYLSALRVFQRELGTIHDLGVARQLIGELAAPHHSPARRARRRLERRCARLLSRRAAQLEDPLLGQSALEPFWNPEAVTGT